MSVSALKLLHLLCILLLDVGILLLILPYITHTNLKNNVVRNPNDEKQPEQVDTLQRCQQPKSDILADPTFILLRDPIQIKGSNGAELGEGGVKDYKVEVVAAVDPDADEEGEVRDGDGGIEVAADLGRLSK